MIKHAGLVASPNRAAWRGVLITGPSGSGKSDMALRLLDEGFALVADDRVVLWESGGRLFGRAPDNLAGLIEARGLGIRPQTALPFAPISLVVELHPPEDIDRLPEPSTESLLGVEIPHLDLAPFEPSAAAKLRRALNGLG